MGKHDKQETVFSWEPPKNDYYIAKIQELQAENARLREEGSAMRNSIGNYELVIDHQDEMHTGIVDEYDALLKEKDDEIEVLKGKIKMLEAAIVKGAIREVLA